MYEEMLLQKGWECPKCGRVYSPSTSMCKYCSNESIPSVDVKANYLIKGIDLSETLNDIYYRGQHKYVMEDIKEYIKDSKELNLNEDDIKIIADNFVYKGDYDCNLSYWDNIENLIREYIKERK